MKLIENGRIKFELHPNKLVNMENKERILAIWEFGTGGNYLQKRLRRFFSKLENIGDPRNFEFILNETRAKENRNQIVKSMVRKGW